MSTTFGVRNRGVQVDRREKLTASQLPASVVNASSQSLGTPRLTVGPTAPASPTVNDLWLSTSKADVLVAPGPGQRATILSPSGASNWDSTAVQEPSVWIDGSNFNLLYSGCQVSFSNPALGWATCPLSSDPLVPANWTRQGRILGQGSGGEAGAIQHSKAYYEGGTLYIFYVAAAGGPVKCATGTTPASLTLQGTVLTAQGSATSYSNPRVFKRGTNDYVMTVAATGGASQFEAGYATAATILGPYTLQTFPISSLNPVTNCITDGSTLAKEGSTYIGWQHSSWATGETLPCDIWRATSTDLVNWTFLDSGYPVIRRSAAHEVDQVADIALVDVAAGLTLAFWSAMDNRNDIGYVMAAPVSPVLKRFNGYSWQLVIASSDDAFALGAQALNEIIGRPMGSGGVRMAGALAIGRDHTGAMAEATLQDQITLGTTNHTIHMGGDVQMDTSPNGLYFTRANAGQKILFNFATLGTGAAMADDGSGNLSLGGGANGVRLAASRVGFYNTSPGSKPTITGSKGANAALTSLLSALATLGLITDSTT